MRTIRPGNRISDASLAGERRSPAAWAGSLALHGGVVVATLFTFSHTLEIADQSPPVVPVDVVTIAQKTNIRPSVRPEPRHAPTLAPPVPKAMPAPPVPRDNPNTEPETPKEPARESIAEAPAPAVPLHRPRPPQEKQQKNFDVDKVLALLNKVAPSPAAAPDAPSAARTVKGIGAQNAMSADLQSMLLSQIKPCWSPPVGAPHPVIVDFRVFLNPDGSVAQPPQLLATLSDPYFSAAADAARRAIYTCAPYRLPADRYSQWREISDFHFDPSQMMGD